MCQYFNSFFNRVQNSEDFSVNVEIQGRESRHKMHLGKIPGIGELENTLAIVENTLAIVDQ